MSKSLHRRAIPYAAILSLALSGCAAPAWKPAEHPTMAPSTQPVAVLELNSSQVTAMYHELLAVDLPTVVKVAQAHNIDIEQAQQRAAASRGRYESSVEAIFPVIAPSIALTHIEGVNQNATGTLSPVNFNTLLPVISVQWILNPGRVAYDIIASKRRLEASEQQQEAVLQETLRAASVQYYDLVLAQARLSAAHQALEETQELLRINQLRVRSGAGLPADELRAQAASASAEQDLAVALNNFYQASVALTLTLHLDSSVTLVPQPQKIDQVKLVRDDLPIEQMLATAMQFRADLESARTLLRAVKADAGSVGWAGLGPSIQTGYSYGGLESHTSSQDFSMHEQQKAGVGVGAALDVSTFGRLKTASATERIALLEVQRQIDKVRAAVVLAQQASIANSQIVPAAQQQLQSAQEAMRLTEANLRAGTMLTLDVLQAEQALDDARVRYAKAVVQYNQSQVNLLAAMGVLDEKNLVATETELPITAPASERADRNAD